MRTLQIGCVTFTTLNYSLIDPVGCVIYSQGYVWPVYGPVLLGVGVIERRVKCVTGLAWLGRCKCGKYGVLCLCGWVGGCVKCVYRMWLLR